MSPFNPNNDILPETAEWRLAHYTTRLAVFEEGQRREVLAGAVSVPNCDPNFYYKRLLSAQVDFAREQIRALRARRDEAGASQPTKEGSQRIPMPLGGDDDLPR